jgi:sarcosine oxidase gamma subunit
MSLEPSRIIMTVVATLLQLAPASASVNVYAASPKPETGAAVVKGLLVGSGIAASEQGIRVIKGVPDEWRLFAVGG